jgi:hypothetical protein
MDRGDKFSDRRVSMKKKMVITIGRQFGSAEKK